LCLIMLNDKCICIKISFLLVVLFVFNATQSSGPEENDFGRCAYTSSTVKKMDVSLVVQTKKRFACDVCAATFAEKGTLTRHKRTHSGVKPYTCDVCSLSFAQSSTLSKHKKTHLDEKMFVCDLCPSAFAVSGALVVHKRTHTGERPHKCDQCEFTFIQSGHLVEHKRTHTGDKPFQCEQCDAAFAQGGHLAEHKRWHDNIRPYPCTYCEYSAVLSEDLKRHIRIHTGEKPYKCSECDDAFAQRGTLKSHIYYYHTKKGQADRKRKEARICKLLKEHNIPFDPERHVSFRSLSGTFARIDFFNKGKAACIVLEVDENQHESYTCDLERMNKLQAVLTLEGNELPVVYIRYNPDKYTVDGNKGLTKRRDREAKLIEFIKDVIDGKFPEGMNQVMAVQYMYYDTIGDNLRIWSNADYDARFRDSFCLKPII
jgi:hypothetical protein